jgi:hypothetical protein
MEIAKITVRSACSDDYFVGPVGDAADCGAAGWAVAGAAAAPAVGGVGPAAAADCG